MSRPYSEFLDLHSPVALRQRICRGRMVLGYGAIVVVAAFAVSRFWGDHGSEILRASCPCCPMIGLSDFSEAMKEVDKW